MIEAKEIDGELWIKASDHHQSVKKAIEHEREAIAKMVDPWLLPEYVEKIRARGNTQ